MYLLNNFLVKSLVNILEPNIINYYTKTKLNFSLYLKAIVIVFFSLFKFSFKNKIKK